MSLQTQQLLYQSRSFSHHYLCHYVPVSSGNDKLSKSLIHIKLGWPLHVAAWTECSVAELRKIEPDRGSLFLRAIGSSETTCEGNKDIPLDQLGKMLAKEFNGFYLPQCLMKKRKTEKVARLSRDARTAELSNVYSFTLPVDIDIPEHIVIIDDILTTGATMCAVINAISTVLPKATIELFTLASTDHNSVLNASIKLQGEGYEWQPAMGWNMVKEGVETYYTMDILKLSIITDIW